MSSVMMKEILSTPSLLPATAAACEAACRQIAARLRADGIKRIFLACRGSSENAGVFFKYLCETLCGISVSVLRPSVFTVYDASVDLSGSLLIAVSQGGRGVDIRMVAEEAKRQGVYTVAVTNFPESPIGKLCDAVLPLSVELERSMAATKSFTAEMYALYLLAMAIKGTPGGAELPAAFARGLERAPLIPSACAFLDSAAPCYVLGRGKLYAIAREACCKLQETCLVSAFPFSAADFMHGPFALVEAGSHAIVLHSRFACTESTLGLINSLLKQNADILVITDDPSVRPLCSNVIVVDSSCEDESVFAMTAVIQLLAATLSEIRGTNPDTSRNLSKYTETV